MRLGLVLLFCVQCLPFFAQLQSPNAFLPHDFGKEFTPHHLLVDYVEHVAENSPNVQLMQYGRTNQKRPLQLAFISSEENLAQLEAIRKNNLIKTGLLEGNVDPTLDRAILWMSFGVHGNEAAGPESGILALYELTRSDNPKVKEWLKNTIVLFDPSINPDGYSRYTHWYNNVAPLIPDPNPNAREHIEPWPGGRVNHYLFDLNRDWAWQTQIESQQRAILYLQWMPHIHVDFHEQFYNSPYYFAPAARPYHDYITDWQVNFQTEIGKNHARYFDAEGWLYFTREVFDLFYPSYGDTYPIFHGAIGMTHEQAGHSRAGRAIIMENTDTLVLADRIAHHTSTALSNLEMASKNADRLIKNFEAYFTKSSTNPPGAYKTYIIDGDNPEGRIKALCKLLDKNQIQYGKAKNSTTITALDYTTRKEKSIKIKANDLLISAYQPLGLFTQVLFDPTSDLEDSLTYDITAWSLPYAYGLETYASKQKIQINLGYDFEDSYTRPSSTKAYAYLSKWQSMDDARFLSRLMKAGVKVRYSMNPFTLEGTNYQSGTLVITRADNRKIKTDFDQTIKDIAAQSGQTITAVRTGFSNQGSDLGSGSMVLIKTPKVLLVSGEETNPYSFGQAWYYFEQDLGYPVTIIEADQMASFDMNGYNLLVLTDGQYKLNDSGLEKLNSWISAGGRLIAVGSALYSFRDKSGFKLSRYATKTDKGKADKKAEQEQLANRLNHYSEQERRWIQSAIPGAIFKLNIDNSHPLGFGLDDYYFTLKTGSQSYQLLKGVWNVGTLGEELNVSGFAGSKAQEGLKNSVVFAVQDKGQGSITYMVDNPLYRSFWENGKFLFSNAVFLVGQ